jgi:MFS family permease
MALIYSAHRFWTFAIAMAFSSLSFACYSGTAEALLYESLVETGQADSITKYNGRISSAGSLSTMIFPLLGSIIARDLTGLEFHFLIVFNAVFVLGGLIPIWLIAEPPCRRSVAKQEIGVFRNSLLIIRECPWLLRIGVNKALVFLATFIVWRVYQPYLTTLGVGVVALGFFCLIQSGINSLSGGTWGG